MKLSRKFLAGALVALLPMSGAIACTNAAWLGTPGANPTLAEDPDSNNATNNSPDNGAVARYSGQCGLRADPNGASFVTDNNPGGEAIYRARFYVFTSKAGAKVFSATTTDNGGGTEVVGVTFSGSAFQFAVNGTTAPDVGGIAANRWYSVEFLYQANGSFTASVQGNQAASASTTTSAGNAGALTVGSARLGDINAAASASSVLVDEFDSSRSAATAIGRLCRGDANTAQANVINVFDRVSVVAELLGNSLASGQPDCTEDGNVNVFDSVCVTNIILNNGGACP